MTGGELETLQRRARDMQRAARWSEALRRIGWALVLAAVVLGLGGLLSGCAAAPAGQGLRAPAAGMLCDTAAGAVRLQALQAHPGHLGARALWQATDAATGRPVLIEAEALRGCRP